MYPFQFHTGSIKSEDYLNTLEETYPFQFHTGSIKSPFFRFILASHRFQFHTGSIKRVPKDLKENKVHRFNSILVRLKAHRQYLLFLHEHLFQFHTGSIKS